MEVRECCRAAAQRNADIRDAHLDARRAKQRKYYRKRREQGVCVDCGKDAQGKKLCSECALYKNQYRSGASTAPRSPYKDGRRS